MKSYFSILLLFLSSFSAHALCSMTGVWSWPKSPIIRPNGIIMLEFYAFSQSMVEGLKTKYPIYLKSGRDTISLHITEVLKGQLELTQVILRLGKQLLRGSRMN